MMMIADAIPFSGQSHGPVLIRSAISGTVNEGPYGGKWATSLLPASPWEFAIYLHLIDFGYAPC